MDLTLKNPTGGQNCDVRHDATDILTDTSPAFRPLFAHGLRGSARRSAGRCGQRLDPPEHRPETAAASGYSPPAAYGVAIRGEATFTVADVPGPLSASALADSAPDDAWESVTWGTGHAGPLTAEFCTLRVRPSAGRGDRWLLCERSAPDVRKYYLVHLPATTPLVALVALARRRWPIEQQYRELKDDLGLDHCEGRTYQGWTHHVVLTAVAFPFLQIERARATDELEEWSLAGLPLALGETRRASLGRAV